MSSFLIAIGFFAIGFVCSLLIIGCATGPSSENQVQVYNSALTESEKTPTAAPGSPEEQQGIANWKSLLADLASDSIGEGVKNVYAEELFFNDTLKTIRSSEELAKHFSATADLLHSGSVKYLSEMRDEKGNYYVRWEMTYSGKKLNGGDPIVTIGMSQLRLNEKGKVIFHQDFWDSTAGVFEHIPFVGGQVKMIRARM